jgi:hypothetical protein
MDASCKVQKSIHVFRLVHKSMCPGFWVHIKMIPVFRPLSENFNSGQTPILEVRTKSWTN